MDSCGALCLWGGMLACGMFHVTHGLLNRVAAVGEWLYFDQHLLNKDHAFCPCGHSKVVFNMFDNPVALRFPGNVAPALATSALTGGSASNFFTLSSCGFLYDHTY